MSNAGENGGWMKCSAQVFWGEIAPSNHLVQIYENDDILLDSVEGFIETGIKDGDSVIIIATEVHLGALEMRLRRLGFGVDTLRATGQYIPVSAQKTLTRFMVDGWPDEGLFREMVSDLIRRAQGPENRRVRAYGEMVALLWEQGNSGATVHLEHLWSNFCKTETFCLFCAYPKAGFTQDSHESIRHICSAHTKVLSGGLKSSTEVFYKDEILSRTG